VGRVLIAANALDVTINGIAIDGELEMEPDAGVTASLTLRNTLIAGSDHGCTIRPELPAFARRRTP
jgi:hypothetical protein